MERREIEVEGTSQRAVQRALDAAGPDGAIVRLARGTYVIDEPLLLDRRTTLAGAGRDATRLVLAPGVASHLVANRVPGAEHLGLRSLALDGSAAAKVRPDDRPDRLWACGARFTGVRHLRLTDVAIIGVRQHGLHLDGCAHVTVDGLEVTAPGWSGIAVDASSDLSFERVVVRDAGRDGTRSGIHVDGGTDVTIHATVDGASGSGIAVDSHRAPTRRIAIGGTIRGSLRGVSVGGASEHRTQDVVVTGELTGNVREGVLVTNGRHVTVVGATIADNGEHGVLLQGQDGSHDCTVTDCTLTGNPVDVAEAGGSSDNLLVTTASATTTARTTTARTTIAGKTASGASRPSAAGASLLADPRGALREIAPPQVRRVARIGRTAVRTRGRSIARKAPPSVKQRVRAIAGGSAANRRRIAADGPASTAATPTAATPTAPPPTTPASASAATPPATYDHSFTGPCRVCGVHGTFVYDRRSIREAFGCTSCKAHLRYQGQAQVLIEQFGEPGTASLADLVAQPRLQQLDVYEPGVLGPFRSSFADHPSYVTSAYWPDVEPGQARDGVRCEDLMALTFPDESFDLVITSDIFEHIRHPMVAFAEVARVLRPGGVHVFSIPAGLPMRSRTLVRVDVSGPDDVMLEEPAFHGGAEDTQHLVYNDFGLDLLPKLGDLGLDTVLVPFDADDEKAARLVTFCSTKRPA